MCNELYRDGVIRPSQSPWSSPVVLQKKKDNTWRFCVDYRKLDDVTDKDNYPLPRIQDILNSLNGAKVFSKLDFRGGYHQIPIDERDKQKTAFVVNQGLWEYNVMPQGIKNGPPTFQRIVDRLLAQLDSNCALAYIDDIVVYSTSVTDHFKHLEQVLSLLHGAKFQLNSSKCELFKNGIQYLGHIINANGVAPCPENTRAIVDLPTPTNTKAAISFIKMAEYYHNHIENFSIIADPIFELTRKNAVFEWNERRQHAFDTIKKLLTSRPLLRFPDSTLPFVVQVDAANTGVGAVLMQDAGNGEQPVAFMSQKLNRSQRNWCTTEKECFAVVSAIRKWSHYIAGRDFTVRTDHHALCWLNRRQNNNPKLNRWRLMLQEHSFSIQHVKGSRNCVPDCLSRFPINMSFDDDAEYRSITTQTDESMVTSANTVNQITDYRSPIDRLDEKKSSISMRINGSKNVVSVITRSMDQGRRLDQSPASLRIEAKSKTAMNLRTTADINQNTIDVFDIEELKVHQQQDLSINKIIENLHLKPFSNEYKLQDGLLCRFVNNSRGCSMVPVIPRSKVKDVLLAYHNSSINGSHFGKDRTYYKIRDRFFWSGMYKDVEDHVKTCPNCSVNKYARRKPVGHLNSMDPPNGVWENLAMDFVGPIAPTSTSGKNYILVITDLLSKFVITKATHDNKALTAAKVLVEEVILKFGAPNQILTDNGSHFTGKLFEEITSLCGVCHVRTIPYHPQANGACERFNSSLCENLASICNSRRTNWDQQLSKTTFAYNTSRHTSTRMTPFHMMFGRHPKLPFDLHRSRTTATECHEYTTQLTEYLRTALESVTSNISRDQMKVKERYDRNRPNEIFDVGDFVYVQVIGLRPKLAPKYDGPYQVIQRLNSCCFRVQNINDLREIINVHSNRLRRQVKPSAGRVSDNAQ